MIGQHLILRCKRGCFETAGAAGFKSAGISENLRNQPNIKTLDQEIRKVLTWSDKQTIGTMLPGLQNRGVLRIYRFNGMTFVSRSFPVKDLCTNSGDVPFHQTYVLTENDQKKFLEVPECVLNRKNYDVYEDLDQRSGTLSSGNPVVVNEKLDIFSDIQALSPYDVFSKCGFDEDSFSKLISAICDRVSGNGNVALVLPQIDATEWKTTGGSFLGEQILVALYKVLPNCLTRFLSGVSYWNSDVRYIESLKFVVASSEIADALYKDSISLIDLKHRVIRNVGNSLLFGKLLWNAMQNEESLKSVHAFISDLFGEKIDQIKKTSLVMDTVAGIYLYKYQRWNNSDLTALTALTARILGIFKKNILNFPKIDQYCGEMLSVIKQNPSYNLQIEKVASEFVQTAGIHVSACYDPLMYILLQYVANETFSGSTKEMILKKLQQQDPTIQNQMLKFLEDAKIQEISEKKADFFLSLPGLERINPKIQQEARFVLNTRYPDFVKNGYWKICVDIMQLVYFPCISNFTDVQIFDTYYKFRDLYCILQEHALEKRMFEMMSQEMKRVGNHEEQIQLFCQCFFDAKSSSSLSLIQNHPEVFRVFLQVLAFLKPHFQKYSEKHWRIYYKYIFENANIPNQEAIVDKYCSKNEKGNVLYNMEAVRIQCDRYDSNWDIMEQIFDALSEESLYERMQKIYNLVTVISKKSPSFMNGIAKTQMLYGDYLLQSENLGNSRWKNDVDSLVFQNSRGVPVLSNLQKIAADEIEKEQRLSQVFPVAYCELWKAVLATPLNRCSVDEIVHQVKIAESFLTDYPRKEEVLAEIHRVAFEQLPVEKLQNANEESIAYLYANGKNMLFYSKVSAYYEMDQLLVSCNDFQKVPDIWNKLNANLDYRERLERRRWILCSKRNPSEQEKQTLVFLVLYQIKSSNYMFSIFWNLLAVNQNAMVSAGDKPIYLCYSILFCRYINDINLQNTCVRFFTNEICRCMEDGDVRQHLKNAEFKKLYQDIKNTYFWNKDDEKKEIYQAAKNTGDSTLMEIFKVGKDTGNSASTQKEETQKFFFKVFGFLILLIITVVGTALFLPKKPFISMIISAFTLGLLIVFMVLVELGIFWRKKGEER